MLAQARGVELEVQPVESEGLDEGEEGFGEEGRDGRSARLVQQGDDGVAEDEGDESVGALDAVLDVEGGVEVEEAGGDGSQRRDVLGEGDEGDVGGLAGDFEKESGKDEGEAGGVGDLDAAYPEGGGGKGDQRRVEHYGADHWDEAGDEDEVGGHVQAGGEVKADEGGVGVGEGFNDVGRVAEEAGEEDEDGDTLEDVVCFEPGDDHCHVIPDFPGERESDLRIAISWPERVQRR